jgi:hypothetical protein
MALKKNKYPYKVSVDYNSDEYNALVKAGCTFLKRVMKKNTFRVENQRQDAEIAEQMYRLYSERGLGA